VGNPVRFNDPDDGGGRGAVCYRQDIYLRGILQITLWPNSSVSKSPTRGAGWGDGREPFHLFRYLDEQAFRFNERKDTDAGRFVKAKASVTNDLYRDKVFSWTPNLPSQPHSSGSMRSPVK